MNPGQEQHASIVVDMWNFRCDRCKVALHDDLVTECPACGAVFDAIVSNHVGLAARFYAKREAEGVLSAALR